MNGFYQVKSIGRKRPVLEKVPFTLSEEPRTLRDLLYAVTASEAARYRAMPGEDASILPYLTGEEMSDRAAVGKVAFGRRYGERIPDEKKAGETACQGFEDGMFKVFVEDRELERLEEELDWKDGSVLTFIRLTFLSGRVL